MTNLPHLDATGAAHMVDVSAKPATAREARATGRSDPRAADGVNFLLSPFVLSEVEGRATSVTFAARASTSLSTKG